MSKVLEPIELLIPIEPWPAINWQIYKLDEGWNFKQYNFEMTKLRVVRNIEWTKNFNIWNFWNQILVFRIGKMTEVCSFFNLDYSNNFQYGNSKKFQFGKFKKFLIWKIKKNCNLRNSKIYNMENSKHFQFAKFWKFQNWWNSKNFQFRKYQNFSMWKFQKFATGKF